MMVYSQKWGRESYNCMSVGLLAIGKSWSFRWPCDSWGQSLQAIFVMVFGAISSAIFDEFFDDILETFDTFKAVSFSEL